jgi:hypothetical protein
VPILRRPNVNKWILGPKDCNWPLIFDVNRPYFYLNDHHNHGDGKHYHFVWGPGGPSDAASNQDVREAYAARNEGFKELPD